MRKRRAELLDDLLESNKLLLPERVFQMVPEVKGLSGTFSFIDEKEMGARDELEKERGKEEE